MFLANSQKKAEVSLLQRNGAWFVFPDIKDKAFVYSDDIVLAPLSPAATKRIEQTKQGLTFHNNLSSYNVR